MLSLSTLVAVSLFGTVATPLNQPASVVTDKTPQVALQTIAPEPTPEPRFICKGCTENENAALNFFQDKGIRDRNALATILGNIKQESTFVPNICEGGARTTYHGCRVGGFGLIQFTSSDRYHGLGTFAKRVGGDPASLDVQLNYILTEPQWLRIQQRMQTPGKSIDRYMAYAYSWIGWGIHGARTNYAYDYANRLVLSESNS
jgi:hypothetical protein